MACAFRRSFGALRGLTASWGAARAATAAEQAERMLQLQLAAAQDVAQGSMGTVLERASDKCAQVRRAALSALAPAALAGDGDAISVAAARLQDADEAVRSTALGMLTKVASCGDERAVTAAIAGLQFRCRGLRWQTPEHQIALSVLARRAA